MSPGLWIIPLSLSHATYSTFSGCPICQMQYLWLRNSFSLLDVAQNHKCNNVGNLDMLKKCHKLGLSYKTLYKSSWLDEGKNIICWSWEEQVSLWYCKDAGFDFNSNQQLQLHCIALSRSCKFVYICVNIHVYTHTWFSYILCSVI